MTAQVDPQRDLTIDEALSAKVLELVQPSLDRPEVRILFEGLEQAVGFNLDTQARWEIIQAIATYWFHPTCGFPPIDYQQRILHYMRHAIRHPETRNQALFFADYVGLEVELLLEGGEEYASRSEIRSSPPCLPMHPTSSVKAIRKLIATLGRVEEIAKKTPRNLLERVRRGDVPTEYSNALAEFRRDVERDKQCAMADFPMLALLFESVVNERRLQEKLKEMLCDRKEQAVRPLRRRDERQTRNKQPNWRKVTAQISVYETLQHAAERAGCKLRLSDLDRFLQLLNPLIPTSTGLGTVKAIRAAADRYSSTLKQRQNFSLI